MDFTDEKARLVITVGIPYPAFKDPQVEQKRLYNNNKVKQAGTCCLTGDEWWVKRNTAQYCEMQGV